MLDVGCDDMTGANMKGIRPVKGWVLDVGCDDMTGANMKGIQPVKGWVLDVGCDDLTGALHDLRLQLSLPLPLSLASIKPANLHSPGKMTTKTERRVLLHTACTSVKYFK